jgi:nucleoside 2-deoxyribosyltransferase
MKPIAYLAGPLGFSAAGTLFHKTVLIPLVVEAGFDISDPWELTPFALIKPVLDLPFGAKKKRSWEKLNRIIGQNNEDAIKESNIIVAVLDGIDVDSGTAAEIACGAMLGKPTFGYRGDFRLASDNLGSIVNLQVEHFIYTRGGVIVQDMESLKMALVKYRAAF